MEKLHLIIKGTVQGVFFRIAVKDFARDNGIKGWVKNKEDGSVEVVGVGKKEKLNMLFEFCKKGPGSAVVTKVQENWSQVKENPYFDFQIKH